jgi:hypothetical protein
MQENTEIRYRMYFLTMYNISPIQQGIQSLHAVVEYAQKYFNTPEYQRWASKDKTVILLNGGTSNLTGTNHYDMPQSQGSMENHMTMLMMNDVDCAAFNEPDLNNATASVAFLVPEQVWDRETYPDPVIDVQKAIWYSSPKARREAEAAQFQEALEAMYGKKVAFLRTYLSRLRLA